MSYNGLMALQTGILVAFTQAIPEHQILLFGALGVRVKVISSSCPAIRVGTDVHHRLPP